MWKSSEWSEAGGGLSVELGAQGTEPWAEGWGETESGQSDRALVKGETRPGPESGGRTARRTVPPGDTRELGRKVVSTEQTALARGQCPCSHPGRKLSLAFINTRSLGWPPGLL